MNDYIKNILFKINSLKNFENYVKQYKNNLVFLCVGNSEIWYDSFGPIVGGFLKHKYNINAFVYGDIYNCIKLSNLNKYIEYINKKHSNCKIIVIDAALTSSNNNELLLKEGATKCAYFSSKSKMVGHYSILCPVKSENEDKIFNYRKIISNALLISEIISKYLN